MEKRMNGEMFVFKVSLNEVIISQVMFLLKSGTMRIIIFLVLCDWSCRAGNVVDFCQKVLIRFFSRYAWCRVFNIFFFPFRVQMSRPSLTSFLRIWIKISQHFMSFRFQRESCHYLPLIFSEWIHGELNIFIFKTMLRLSREVDWTGIIFIHSSIAQI